MFNDLYSKKVNPAKLGPRAVDMSAPQQESMAPWWKGLAKCLKRVIDGGGTQWDMPKSASKWFQDGIPWPLDESASW